MNKNKKVIIFILIILINSGTEAEELPNKRKFFIEASALRSIYIPNTNLHQIDDTVMNKNNDFNNRQEVIGDRTTAYGSDQQKLASIYAFLNSPKPKLTSQSFSMFAEYLFFPKVGFGISLNNTNFQAHNISETKFDNNFRNDLLNSYLTNQTVRENSIVREILLPYTTKSNSDFLRILSVGFHVSYHFINHKTFDPYIRLGLGYGRNNEDMAVIYLTTLSLGSRFFLTDKFYLLAECTGSNYDAFKVKDSSLFESKKNNLSHVWSLQEYSGKIGIGFAF